MSKESRMAAMDAYEKAAKKYKSGKNGDNISLRIKKDKRNDKIVEHYNEFPNFYLNDVKLPVGKNDVGKDMKAEIAIRLVDYGEDNSTKGETNRFTFAIKTIKFLRGK